MNVELTDTVTSQVARELVMLRRQGELADSARVLTLLVQTRPSGVERAVESAQLAAREHPCRVIVCVEGDATAPSSLNASIRVGGDAGASEVIVLTGHGELAVPDESLISALLLPDDPVVTWWPEGVPSSVAETPLGQISRRRITDSSRDAHPLGALQRLAADWHPGDTDLAWTRLSLWRTQITSIVDQFGVRGLRAVTVHGAVGSPSTALLAAWLQLRLPVPVHVATAPGHRLLGVRLDRGGRDIELSRPQNDVAELYLPGQAVQHVALPERTVAQCLAEELRRLDDDVVLGEVLREGLPACDLSPVTPSPR